MHFDNPSRLTWGGTALAALLAGQLAHAGALGDVATEIDRTMATFDPVGQYIKDPIEQAVPRLRLKGFYRQWTDVLLNEHGQIGNVDQDFRFLQLQNLVEVQGAYHIAEGLELNGVTHFLYDGVYDWQSSRGLYADRIDKTAEMYHTTDRVLREFYVSFRRPGFDVLVGKQQIAWGKMDGQFIDVINGMDRREFVQLESEDYEWRRLPNWMVNTTLHFGANSLQLLYIFDFEQDRLPLPGSPWYSPQWPTNNPEFVLNNHRPHAGDFNDHQYGMRFDRSAGALTYGFIYFYGWDKNPVEHVLGTTEQGARTLLQVRPEYERLHHAGVTADYAFTFSDVPLIGNLPTVLRVEGLYTNGVRFADFAKRELARQGARLDGTTKSDTMRAAVAAEFGLPGRTTMIFQASYYRTLQWRESFGAGFGGGIGDKWTMIPVLFVSRPFAFSRDRLSVEATIFPVISGPDRTWQGIKTKVRANFKFSQFVKGSLVYNGYDGGTETGDYYGQFKRYDNIGWELNYAF